MTFRTSAVLALAGLAACTATPGTDDPVETGMIDSGATDMTDVESTDTTDVEIEDPMWNTSWTNDWTDAIDCGTSGEVTIELETVNWGGDAALYISQTPLLRRLRRLGRGAHLLRGRLLHRPGRLHRLLPHPHHGRQRRQPGRRHRHPVEVLARHPVARPGRCRQQPGHLRRRRVGHRRRGRRRPRRLHHLRPGPVRAARERQPERPYAPDLVRHHALRRRHRRRWHRRSVRSLGGALAPPTPPWARSHPEWLRAFVRLDTARSRGAEASG